MLKANDLLFDRASLLDIVCPHKTRNGLTQRLTTDATNVMQIDRSPSARGVYHLLELG